MLTSSYNDFFVFHLTDSQLPSAFIIQLTPSKDLKCFPYPVGPLEKHPRIEVLGRCCDGPAASGALKCAGIPRRGYRCKISRKLDSVYMS